MIELIEMTKQLARRFFNGFENDPDVYEDADRFTAYQYSAGAADAYWERQQRLGRIHLAVMQDDQPIGEIILKNLDHDNGCCTLSIHLKNDSVKNQGYGTRAEILALEFVFNKLEMETVYADALTKNVRSRHVLEKVGFLEIRRGDVYCYYKCSRVDWLRPNGL